MPVAEILSIFYQSYVAVGGLVRLHPSQTKDPVIDNDNGVLFLAMSVMLFSLMGLHPDEFKEQCFLAIAGIETELGHFRRSANDKRANSHDDYVAIAMLSDLFEFDYGKQMVSYLERVGWVIDGERLQGGDVAFIKLCSRTAIRPPFYETWWMFLGAFTGIFSSPSTRNICWFRMAHLSSRKDGIGLMATVLWALLGFRQPSGVDNYFVPDHPVNRLMHRFVEDNHGT